MKLSRKTRAACELTLACLRRRDDLSHAAAALTFVGGWISLPFHSARCDLVTAMTGAAQNDSNADDWEARERDYNAALKLARRLLRARLALYLRSLLRANAGDFGPWRSAGTECDGYCAGWRVVFHDPDKWTAEEHDVICCGGTGHTNLTRTVRPLWEIASSHG